MKPGSHAVTTLQHREDPLASPRLNTPRYTRLKADLDRTELIITCHQDGANDVCVQNLIFDSEPISQQSCECAAATDLRTVSHPQKAHDPPGLSSGALMERVEDTHCCRRWVQK